MMIVAVDGALNSNTATCKCLQNSQTFAGISSVQWRKVG